MRDKIEEVLVLHNTAEIEIYIVENIVLKLELTDRARARLQNRLAASRNASHEWAKTYEEWILTEDRAMDCTQSSYLDDATHDIGAATNQNNGQEMTN